MKSLRAKLLATGILCASVIGAGAANLSTLSGSQFSEPSQILNTVNTLINNINAGTSGLVAQTQSPVGTAPTTSEQVLSNFIIPPNQLTANGQSLRARCFGTFAANANAKTVRLIISGVATQNGAVISSVQSNINGGSWELELLLTYNTAATNTWMGRGSASNQLSSTNTFLVSPIVATNAVLNFTNSLTAQCNGVVAAGTIGDITSSELIVEQIK